MYLPQNKMLPKCYILQKSILLKFPFKSDACYYIYLHILLEKARYSVILLLTYKNPACWHTLVQKIGMYYPLKVKC